MEDVVQTVAMPSAFLVAIHRRKTERRLDLAKRSLGEFCMRKTTTQMATRIMVNGTTAQARVGPKVGDFAIVLAKFLVALLLATADRCGGVHGLLIAGVVGPGSDNLQLFAGRADVVFVIDPEEPALGPLVDAGFDPESQEVVGEDLGVDPLGQCSDLAQRSIPSNSITAQAASRSDPAPVRRRDSRDRSQTTTRGPPAHSTGLSIRCRESRFLRQHLPPIG